MYKQVWYKQVQMGTNGSRLHLNLKGNNIFTEKFTKAVSNILH